MSDVDEPATPRRVNANQVVAFNMAAYRRAAGMTQAELAIQLQSRTGSSWTKVSVSAAERSWEKQRPKHFDAVQLWALCDIFEVPVVALFLPPDTGGPWTIGAIRGVTTEPWPAKGADLVALSWWRSISGGSGGKAWAEYNRRRVQVSDLSPVGDIAMADLLLQGEQPSVIETKRAGEGAYTAASINQVIQSLLGLRPFLERFALAQSEQEKDGPGEQGSDQ